MPTYSRASFYLSVISFILLQVAQFSAGWAMYETDALQPTYTGLWTVCLDNESTYAAVRETNRDFVRAFMLLATLSSFLTILCSSEWEPLINCTEDFFPEGPLAAVFSFITGFLLLTALIIFQVTFDELLEPRAVPIVDRWAFFLCCFTCGLNFSTGILNFLIYMFPDCGGRPHGSKVTTV